MSFIWIFVYSRQNKFWRCFRKLVYNFDIAHEKLNLCLRLDEKFSYKFKLPRENSLRLGILLWANATGWEHSQRQIEPASSSQNELKNAISAQKRHLSLALYTWHFDEIIIFSLPMCDNRFAACDIKCWFAFNKTRIIKLKSLLSTYTLYLSQRKSEDCKNKIYVPKPVNVLLSETKRHIWWKIF